MKTTYMIIRTFLIPMLITILESASIVSNAQWAQKPSGTINDLYDIHFPTTDTGYAVGYYGTILKSVDKGESWLPLNSGTLTNFEAVEFLNGTTGFAAGDSGIFKTTNGGISWTQLSISTSESLRDIEFINNQTGFCAGGDIGGNGIILKTIDGGNTWNIKAINNIGDPLISSINFPVPDTGYAVTTNYNWQFLKTIDGGETWNVISIAPINGLSSLETVYFTDANTGYIGGWYNPVLIKTNNGGNSWAYKDTTGNTQLYCIYFPSPVIGYSVGWYGEIFKTNNNGDTWTIQNSGIGNETLYSVYFTDDTTGYIVGRSGTILKTLNGGGVTVIDGLEAQNNIAIYPNPSRGKFEIKIENQQPAPNKMNLEIYNTLGEKIYQTTIEPLTPITKDVTINISNQPNGIYFLNIKTEKESFAQKIVIQK